MQDGTSPYHGQSNPAVMQLVRSGGRHPKPSADCTVELFKLMSLCWDEDVARRPTFANMVPMLKRWCAAEDVAKPAVEPRMDAYKKTDGFNNQYNDMGFDNDGTQSPHVGTFDAAKRAAAGGTQAQGGELSAADEAVGYMVTASRAGGGLDAGLRVAGKAAGSFGNQGGDSSGAVEAAGFVLAPGEANVYAGITAAAEGAAVEETEFGFGFGDDE
jgi:hypothetical protein